jgi:1,4-alpha-glucan branching enzyme
MSGDDWQKFANLRALYGYMYGHPGKKLLFMGGEFGQWREWGHDESLDWHLLEYAPHQGLKKWVEDLNHFYASQPPLHELDFAMEGFEWVDFHDADTSVISFIRKGKSGRDTILVVCNFTAVPRFDYIVGAPYGGEWQECLNSDATLYGGSGLGNAGRVEARGVPAQGREYSLSLTLPPLAVIFLLHKE